MQKGKGVKFESGAASRMSLTSHDRVDVIEGALAKLASIHSRKFRKLVDGKFIYIWTARLRDSLVQFDTRVGASTITWLDLFAIILCQLS